MSFMYVAVTKIGDLQGFAEAHKTWSADRLREFGAIDSSALEIVMGGEMAGTVFVSFETETADAAMELQSKIVSDDQMVTMMRDTQVQVVRRGLMRVQAEFGSRQGNYASVLYIGGSPVDDATAQANFGQNWSHLEHGANGMTAMQVIAQGPVAFSGAVTTWADSIDELLAASAKNFSDPKILEQMASSGTSVLGRLLARRLF